MSEVSDFWKDYKPESEGLKIRKWWSPAVPDGFAFKLEDLFEFAEAFAKYKGVVKGKKKGKKRENE